MFHRLRFLKKQVLTEEQVKVKIDVENSSTKAKKDLVEAKELAKVLREIREQNHFARDFRKTLGGNVGRS